MKKIEFIKGQDDKKFEFVYSGFIVGGSLTQQKGLVVLKRELSVLDKLESISLTNENGKKVFGDETLRELIGGTIELDGPEFDMLKTYVSSVPWSSGKAVRDAVATIEWLEKL